jgi:BatD DUF11 like domain
MVLTAMATFKRRSSFQIVLALITSIAISVASAASPAVTAVLNNSEATVGQAVQLQIRITGARNVEVPESIAVDGLEIHRTGTEQHFEMDNFNVSSSVNYNYTILPLKAGTFKIPPQTVRIGGSSFSTPALTLHVASSPSRSATVGPGGQPATGRLAFAELVMTSKSAYVGEMIPAEVRLGFDPRIQPQREGDPEIKGQGFTTAKLEQPRQSFETIGGRSYIVLIYKTAISPVRTGTFDIGPAEMKAVITLPRRSNGSRPRSRSPFDLFDLDNPFSDPFFNDPFGALGERREVDLKSEPVTLEVRPLPPNAPPTFSGAVGNFTMTVEAGPKSVQVGDPITVKATISGRGNFDRTTAPVLEDESGWHKYPPSAKFKQDDDVGISGEKTFEIVVSPNEKKKALPPLVFSYFDPIKQNYVTLRSEPIPIQVQGGAAAPAPTVAAQPAPTAPVAAPTPQPKPQDILYQLSQFGRVESFVPIYMQRDFWLAQLIPLVLLLGFIGWKIRQARIDNREARRIAALQRESAELLRKLRRSNLPPQEYFSGASRAVRVKTALAKNVDPNSVDVEMAASAFDLDESSRTQLRRLFERSDELRYSGHPNGGEGTSPQDRRDVLNLIESLRS